MLVQGFLQTDRRQTFFLTRFFNFLNYCISANLDVNEVIQQNYNMIFQKLNYENYEN
jgi:hypothetical protein